ncbi:hypothetical protein NL676_039685 [Syzygium grande]|nr:hypothetical protein NL676_039685 [Syzygium grande]
MVAQACQLRCDDSIAGAKTSRPLPPPTSRSTETPPQREPRRFGRGAPRAPGPPPPRGQGLGAPNLQARVSRAAPRASELSPAGVARSRIPALSGTHPSIDTVPLRMRACVESLLRVMPLTRFVTEAFGVVTICLVALLVLLGLLCIIYSFYFRSRTRSRDFDQLSYFTGPWVIRITFVLFAIVWGFRMESGILSRNWNGKTIGYILLYCFPVFALQLIITLVGPNLSKVKMADSLALGKLHDLELRRRVSDDQNETVSLIANLSHLEESGRMSPCRNSESSTKRGSISFRTCGKDGPSTANFVELSLFSPSQDATPPGSPPLLGWPMRASPQISYMYLWLLLLPSPKMKEFAGRRQRSEKKKRSAISSNLISRECPRFDGPLRLSPLRPPLTAAASAANARQLRLSLYRTRSRARDSSDGHHRFRGNFHQGASPPDDLQACRGSALIGRRHVCRKESPTSSRQLAISGASPPSNHNPARLGSVGALPSSVTELSVPVPQYRRTHKFSGVHPSPASLGFPGAQQLPPRSVGSCYGHREKGNYCGLAKFVIARRYHSVLLFQA